jgi:hypothetical protein
MDSRSRRRVGLNWFMDSRLRRAGLNRFRDSRLRRRAGLNRFRDSRLRRRAGLNWVRVWRPIVVPILKACRNVGGKVRVVHDVL